MDIDSVLRLVALLAGGRTGVGRGHRCGQHPGHDPAPLQPPVADYLPVDLAGLAGVGPAHHSERGRERLLAGYGPLSLLAAGGLGGAAGRRLGLVWWVLAGQLTGVGGYLDAVYFAGVGFFTVGFGDVVPVGGLARTQERTSSTGLLEAWHPEGGWTAYDRAWADLRRLRAEHVPSLRATTRLPLVPPEFRNHAAPLPLAKEERAR